MNIQFLLEESDNNDDIMIDPSFYDTLLQEFDSKNQIFENDDIFSTMKHYDLNFTLKQLLLICEYYGLLKEIKINKLKKQDIIEQLILFENNSDHQDIVTTRKKLWRYLTELKKDKMMQRFIIW
jgi:hypothetical protein